MSAPTNNGRPAFPARDDAVEAARDAVLDAVATWRAAEKRIAAAYLRGQIDAATFAARYDEAAEELAEIRLASDALDAALRRAKPEGGAR